MWTQPAGVEVERLAKRRTTAGGILADAVRERTVDMPLALLPFGAFLLFQWTFLAAECLERSADERRFDSVSNCDARVSAREYAYDWRHGMEGRWPVALPGFFAVAIATALWAPGKAVRRLLIEGGALLLGATVAARLFSGCGARRAIRSFERHSGLKCAGAPSSSTWTGAATGGLTAASWAALVVAAQRSIVTRRLRPLAVPLTLYVLLSRLRAGKLGSLVVPWVRRVTKRDARAIWSLLLAAVTTAGFLRHAASVSTPPQPSKR